MPRDLSGNATRVNPPGAGGYVFDTLILETQVNGEMNDIYNELTQSISRNGVTQPTANLPMNNFTLTNISEGNAAGKPVRFNALQKGTDIAVTASGNVTVPTEGSYFVLTGTGFNVTGFANTYDGRVFTLELPTGLVLVNSASLLINGGINRETYAGDVITLVQKAAGVYKEISYKRFLGPAYFRGHRNGTATATFANGIGTTFVPTVVEDSYGGHSAGIWTVPYSGAINISASIRCATASVTAIVSVRRNNIVLLSAVTQAGASQPTSVVSGALKVVKGDTLNVVVTWVTAGSFAIDGGIDTSYFNLAMVE